jgi:hypothetical protein
MRWRGVATLAVVMVTVSASSAPAQVCAGRASFNFAPTQVALDAGANSAGPGLGLTAGHGTDRLFGAGSVAVHRRESGSARVITGAIGTDQALSPDNRLRVCPLLTAGHISGPGDVERFGFSVAGDASMLVVNTARIQVRPTIGLDLRHDGIGTAAGLFAQSSTRNSSTFTGGVGFLILNRVSLVPRIVVPLGPIGQTSVHLTVAYNDLR